MRQKKKRTEPGAKNESNS